MDFEEWKKKASYEARRLAGITDLLAEDDPYSIEDDMADAFEEEVDPEEFIREAFEDEIADYGGDDDEAPLDDEDDSPLDEDAEDEDAEDEDDLEGVSDEGFDEEEAP